MAESAELGALADVDARRVSFMRSVCRRPGTASRLPLRRGIQNEWMTSRLVMRSTTGVPTGSTISPLVTIGSGISMPPQFCAG